MIFTSRHYVQKLDWGHRVRPIAAAISRCLAYFVYVVEAAQKPYISIEEGRLLYSMGVHAFADLARDAKAVRKIGRRVLVNVKVLNKYIETMFDEG